MNHHHRRRAVAFPLAAFAVASGLVLGEPGPASAATGCSITASTTDYNGDGYDDAAIGDPYATVAGKTEAGSVTVLLGDADGRIGEGARIVLTRLSFGESPQAGDHFGFDVTLADVGINGRCAELLVGSPGADVSGARDAGMVHLITDYPPAEGTPDLEAITLTQADAGGDVEAGDQLGYSVAITGTTQENRRRLVAGAPGEDAGPVADAGAVSVWEVDDGPTGLGELRQGRRAPRGAVRVPGQPETGDRFGAALAAGAADLAHTSGEPVAHALVIGAPGDTVTGRDGAGSVTVLQEKFESAVLISQDSAGVPGRAEPGDGFGYSLAFAGRTDTASGTLVVGAPREDIGGHVDAGSVTILTNSAHSFVSRVAFSQDTPGVPGRAELRDRFGYSLALGHGNGLLLVGVPTEDVGRIVNAGTVQPVRLTAAPRPVSFDAPITENAAGTPGSVGTDNEFGRVLGSLSGQAEQILTVSSVMAGSGSVYVLPNTASGPRGWLPLTGGAGAPAAGRFGWSVSN